MATIVKVRCRGFEYFGAVRRGPSCVGEAMLTLGAAHTRESYHAEDDSYVCKACTAYGRWVTRAVARLHAAGIARPRSWKEFDLDVRTLLGLDDDKDQEPWLQDAQTWRERSRRATEARQEQGGQPEGSGGRGKATDLLSGGDATHAKAIMARTWRHGGRRGRAGAARTIRACLMCGELLQAWTSPTAVDVRMHGPCQAEFRRTPEGRAWWSRMLQLRREQKLPWAEVLRREPPPYPRREGAPLSEEVLTRHFEWAVRHLLGGESEYSLAAGAEVERSTVNRAIKNTVALLPAPFKVDRQFMPYVLALRAEVGAL